MNNKKILVVGVLAVIVTMMVGYALFSETITINGTATAKGDFAITASCQAGVTEQSIATYYELSNTFTEGGYSNDTCSVNGNTVSYSVNLKYPGATRYFTVSMKNTGSIDAVAQANRNTSFTSMGINMEIKNNSDNSLFKEISYSYIDGVETGEIAEADYSYIEKFPAIGMAYPAIKTSTGELIYEDSTEWKARTYDATTKDNDDDVYVKLEPEDTLIFIIPVNWNSEDTTTGYNYKVVTTLMQPFKQITSDMFQKNMSTCYTGC